MNPSGKLKNMINDYPGSYVEYLIQGKHKFQTKPVLQNPIYKRMKIEN